MPRLKAVSLVIAMAGMILVSGCDQKKQVSSVENSSLTVTSSNNLVTVSTSSTKIAQTDTQSFLAKHNLASSTYNFSAFPTDEESDVYIDTAVCGSVVKDQEIVEDDCAQTKEIKERYYFQVTDFFHPEFKNDSWVETKQGKEIIALDLVEDVKLSTTTQALYNNLTKVSSKSSVCIEIMIPRLPHGDYCRPDFVPSPKVKLLQ